MTLTLAPPLWRGFFYTLINELESLNIKEIQNTIMLHRFISLSTLPKPSVGGVLFLLFPNLIPSPSQSLYNSAKTEIDRDIKAIR